MGLVYKLAGWSPDQGPGWIGLAEGVRVFVPSRRVRLASIVYGAPHPPDKVAVRFKSPVRLRALSSASGTGSADGVTQ